MSTIQEQIAYQNVVKVQNNEKIAELENQNAEIDDLITSTYTQIDSFEIQRDNNLNTISNLQTANILIADTIASLESLNA
jgi:hypothetical protein